MPPTGPRVLAVLLAAVGLAAPARAQGVTELGVRALVTTSHPAAIMAGPEVLLRVGRRDRLAIGAALGGAGGELAGRGEAVWHFLFSPQAEGRPGFYAGAGLAVAASPEWHGLIVAAAGVDWSPGGRSGWMAEVGVGGGVRLAVGYRWRRGGSRE